MEDTNKLLEELLKLAVEKEIPYTQAQVKKMKPEKMEEVMEQYKLKELDKMNEDLVDVMFVKFEQVMKKVSLIKDESTLAEKLKDRKLLRKDVKNVIASLTPLLPYVGLLEGFVVCAGEIYEKMAEQENKNDNSASSETPEGNKHDTPEEPSSDHQE